MKSFANGYVHFYLGIPHCISIGNSKCMRLKRFGIIEKILYVNIVADSSVLHVIKNCHMPAICCLCIDHCQLIQEWLFNLSLFVWLCCLQHTVIPLQHLVSFGLNLVSRSFEFQVSLCVKATLLICLFLCSSFR